jgi:hypothetical protein
MSYRSSAILGGHNAAITNRRYPLRKIVDYMVEAPMPEEYQRWYSESSRMAREILACGHMGHATPAYTIPIVRNWGAKSRRCRRCVQQ